MDPEIFGNLKSLRININTQGGFLINDSCGGTVTVFNAFSLTLANENCNQKKLDSQAGVGPGGGIISIGCVIASPDWLKIRI